MSTIIFWILIGIVQQQGAVSDAFGTQKECEETRVTWSARPETIALSDCTQVTLTPTKPAPVPQDTKL